MPLTARSGSAARSGLACRAISGVPGVGRRPRSGSVLVQWIRFTQSRDSTSGVPGSAPGERRAARTRTLHGHESSVLLDGEHGARCLPPQCDPSGRIAPEPSQDSAKPSTTQCRYSLQHSGPQHGRAGSAMLVAIVRPTGFVALTNAPITRPPTSRASPSTSSPAPARNARASSNS